MTAERHQHVNLSYQSYGLVSVLSCIVIVKASKDCTSAPNALAQKLHVSQYYSAVMQSNTLAMHTAGGQI